MENTSGKSAVLWWIGWIVLTIVSFFIACYLWTGIIARYVGPMDKPGVPIVWIAAVFGTWMLFLVPLIVIMYSKVDKAYEDARMAREAKAQSKAQSEFGPRGIYVDVKERILPRDLSAKLKKLPETIYRGHLVTALLRNGKRVEHIFIKDKKEILGIYGQKTMPFTVEEIKEIEPADMNALPGFEEKGWLRLDGVGSHEPGN